MQKAIDFARSKGVAVVVSAGNSNNAADRQLPASCAEVIVVAANNRQGGRASYSNFGRVVDVAAPGGEAQPTADRILMASNLGTTSPAVENFVSHRGTSFAAPHVAAIAAMLYEKRPVSTFADLKHEANWQKF
jgi:serine protease